MASAAGGDVRCPRCATSMVPGFAAFNSRMNWVTERGFGDASPFKGETIVPLPFASIPHLPGFRCSSCQIITVSYAEP